MRATRVAVLVSAGAVVAGAGCTKGEKTATLQNPPLTIGPASASPTAISWPADAPVHAKFVTLSGDQGPRYFPMTVCTETFVTPVRGSAEAAGEKLAQGDLAVLTGMASYMLSGDGVVMVADVPLTTCDAHDAGTATRRIVRSTQAPELTFMNGAMHAHLDVDDRAVAPTAYVGRLSGTAPVAEHAHAGSWEILCAVEAAGTFTLAGKTERLTPLTCVAVPPDAKHSWQPDPGANLVAVQIYSPPGPEQRFKKLASPEGDR
jgi:hypothetical protein